MLQDGEEVRILMYLVYVKILDRYVFLGVQSRKCIITIPMKSFASLSINNENKLKR